MGMTKNIMGRVFALWAALTFVLTMLVVFIPMWLTGFQPEPRRSIAMHHIYHLWMRFFFFVAGIKLRLGGLENFKEGENYVIVFNHNSMMDVPVSVPFTRGANKTIAKVEMSRVPLFGIIYKRGSVLVDRKSEESRKGSYLQMREVLAMGLHMCIYPEGTRNKTAEPLQRFHDGAFRLSMETGKPILPALIFNSAAVLPKKTFFFWPSRIRLDYLPAVRPENFSTASEMKEQIFQLMKAYYEQHR
jgi:1-acyl-sn-glycerol-3-phosphate acyltransferase